MLTTDSRITMLLARGKESDYTTLFTAKLAAGESIAFGGKKEEVLVVPIEGDAEASTSAGRLGLLGGRTDIFNEAATCAYVPPGTELTVASGGAPVMLLVSSAPTDVTDLETKLYTPDQQTIGTVGRDNWSRTVRTILGKDAKAGRLLAGETITPAGNWSSWPPHRHDIDNPPHEVDLEELYYYKVTPADGFGVQFKYQMGVNDECHVVRDGAAMMVTEGFHPFVGAPGYTFYYYWAMAGEGRVPCPFIDPTYAWIQKPG